MFLRNPPLDFGSASNISTTHPKHITQPRIYLNKHNKTHPRKNNLLTIIIKPISRNLFHPSQLHPNVSHLSNLKHILSSLHYLSLIVKTALSFLHSPQYSFLRQQYSSYSFSKQKAGKNKKQILLPYADLTAKLYNLVA